MDLTNINKERYINCSLSAAERYHLNAEPPTVWIPLRASPVLSDTAHSGTVWISLFLVV